MPTSQSETAQERHIVSSVASEGDGAYIPTAKAEGLTPFFAKKRFQRSPRPSEAERQDYIVALAALRSKFAEARRTNDWEAVDAEIRRHPAPKNSNSPALSKILVGKWASPRHEYVFHSNGTWNMLPMEPGITHGSWRIEGNQYFDTVGVDLPKRSQYTIILLTSRTFIFTDGAAVFYETRIKT